MRNTTIITCTGVFLAPVLVMAQASAIDQYIQSGGPSLDRSWRGKDYSDFVALINSGKIKLPLFNDPTGKLILDRVTSIDNLDFNKDALIPLQSRIQDIFPIIGNTGPFTMKYVTKLAAGDSSLHKEATVLTCFNLYVTSQCIELMNQAKITILKDSWNQTRQEGLNKILHGYTEQVLGCEQSLNENIYTSEDFSIFIKTLSENLPTMRTTLSAQVKAELALKFKRHLSRFKNPQDQINIKNIINILGS